jgi:hypothetical protein
MWQLAAVMGYYSKKAMHNSLFKQKKHVAAGRTKGEE